METTIEVEGVCREGARTSPGTLNCRAQNAELAERVLAAAAARGLGATRYACSLGHFDGYHRYAIYLQPAEGRPFGTRSIRVVGYWNARYTRDYLPSICGEREALDAVLMYLETGNE